MLSYRVALLFHTTHSFSPEINARHLRDDFSYPRRVIPPSIHSQEIKPHWLPYNMDFYYGNYIDFIEWGRSFVIKRIDDSIANRQCNNNSHTHTLHQHWLCKGRLHCNSPFDMRASTQISRVKIKRARKSWRRERTFQIQPDSLACRWKWKWRAHYNRL